MIAVGVAFGFFGWFIALVAGFAIADKDPGAGVFMMLVSFMLMCISFGMVAP